MSHKFIELTIDNVDEKHSINFDLVRRFYRGPRVNYTVIEFSDGASSAAVKESPKQILEMLGSRSS
jgi:hypothetical protein